MSLKAVSPEQARQLLNDGGVLVDIREADEHARERIASARHLPLSRLDNANAEFPKGKPVIFHCRSGARTQANASRLEAAAGEGCEAFIESEPHSTMWATLSAPRSCRKRQAYF